MENKKFGNLIEMPLLLSQDEIHGMVGGPRQAGTIGFTPDGNYLDFHAHHRRPKAPQTVVDWIDTDHGKAVIYEGGNFKFQFKVGRDSPRQVAEALREEAERAARFINSFRPFGYEW